MSLCRYVGSVNQALKGRGWLHAWAGLATQMIAGRAHQFAEIPAPQSNKLKNRCFISRQTLKPRTCYCDAGISIAGQTFLHAM